MKTILRFLRPWLLFALAAPLLMLIEVFMDLMLPTIMARIVDQGISNQDLSLVLHLGSMMLIYTGIAFISGAGCSIMATQASTGLGADLRQSLYQKVMSLSYANLDQLETGKIITRLTNDVSQLEDTTRMMLRIMIRAPLQVIGSLLMAIYISRQLSMSFLVLIPLLLITLGLIIRKAYPLYHKVQNKLDTLNSRVQENLGAKRLVKVFVREDYEIKRFKRANAELMQTNIQAGRTMAWIQPGVQLIMNAGIIITLWFGAELIDSGSLRIGALIAFMNYLRQLLFSLMMFSNLLTRFSRAQASSARIEELLDTPADIKEAKPQSRPQARPDSQPCNQAHSEPQSRQQSRQQSRPPEPRSLEFERVSFSFNKNHGDQVLKDISLRLEQGQTLAILGATGAGKSSLVHLIPRFYDIDSGSIRLDGQDIRQKNLQELRHQCAIAPQQTMLFSGSIRQNILYHYPESRHQEPALESLMQETAAIADIAGFIESLPSGYDTNINQRGVNLSGGQKQRLCLARALAKKAPILILDDSTSAVDIATEKRIHDALKNYSAGSLRIVVAQRILSVMQAEQILVLEDGVASGLGTHQELLQTNSLYREIYHSQVDGEQVNHARGDRETVS